MAPTHIATQAAARPARKPRHPLPSTKARRGGGGDGQSIVSTSMSLPSGGKDLSGRLVACRCTRRNPTADKQEKKRSRGSKQSFVALRSQAELGNETMNEMVRKIEIAGTLLSQPTSQ